MRQGHNLVRAMQGFMLLEVALASVLACISMCACFYLTKRCLREVSLDRMKSRCVILSASYLSLLRSSPPDTLQQVKDSATVALRDQFSKLATDGKVIVNCISTIKCQFNFSWLSHARVHFTLRAKV